MTIMQGDQTAIAVKLTDEAGGEIIPNDVSDVVITLGAVTRHTTDETYPVQYDPILTAWIFAVTQEDTLAFRAGVFKLSARVLFTDGAVGGANVATVFVLPSQNTEVLDGSNCGN